MLPVWAMLLTRPTLPSWKVCGMVAMSLRNIDRSFPDSESCDPGTLWFYLLLLLPVGR